MVTAMNDDPGTVCERDPAALKARYDAGESLRVISAATGIPLKTVHRRLAAAGTRFRSPGGLPGPRPRRALDDTRLAEAAAAYTDEKNPASLDDLAGRYGRSPETIARGLRGIGVTIRPRGRSLACGPDRPGTGSGRPLPPGPELAVAYARAGSLRALAVRLDAREPLVRGGLAEAGVPVGSLRSVPRLLREDVARLAAGGAGPDLIAKRTGLSPGTLGRLGLPCSRSVSPAA